MEILKFIEKYTENLPEDWKKATTEDFLNYITDNPVKQKEILDYLIKNQLDLPITFNMGIGNDLIDGKHGMIYFYVKSKKKAGRPKMYTQKKDRYSVYNKKKPQMRVTSEEKKLLKFLRKNQKIYDNLIQIQKASSKAKNNVVTSINNVVTNTIDNVTTKSEKPNNVVSEKLPQNNNVESTKSETPIHLPPNLYSVLDSMEIGKFMKTIEIATECGKSAVQVNRDLRKLSDMNYVESMVTKGSHNSGYTRIL